MALRTMETHTNYVATVDSMTDAFAQVMEHESEFDHPSVSINPVWDRGGNFSHYGLSISGVTEERQGPSAAWTPPDW